MMRILPLILALLPAALGAQAPRPVSEDHVYRPLAVPDRIVLTWTGDPARSQAVSWRTDTSVDSALAQIARASANPGWGAIEGFPDSSRTLPATTEPLQTDLGKAHFHTALFADLEPGTLYAYRVGDGANWSEWFHFRTASEKAAPFSFVYFGDAQNELKSLWSRVVRAAYGRAPQAAFLLHAGDLINRASRDAEWGEWFYAAGWINGMLPSVPAAGNHEYSEGHLASHWRPQFALPENGPEGLEESTYYLDYQGVRLVVLNSNEKREEQVPWLDRVLAENPHRWTILSFHHPIFSTAKGRDNKELREAWMPVIDRHKVDLVLQGHDHTYGRTGNVRAGKSVRNQDSGTVYVVSVSGPKMYPVQKEPVMQRLAEDTQLYQIISIDGDRLLYQAYTATDELYDAFELRKDAKGTNRLIDKVPQGMREYRRPGE